MIRTTACAPASRIVTIVVLLLGTVSAFAQSAEIAPGQAKTSDYSGLEAIIVTARKRDERLQDVPVSITALTTADLTRYETQSLKQVAAQVPELVLGSSFSSSGGVINLRGIGSPDTGPAIDQAVSLNLDGVQVSSANALRIGLHDLQDIEILKGPQALFYGKNSPAGVISIVSADPGKEFQETFRTGYEFYNQQKFAEGTVSGPITDTLGARVVGYFSNQNGWFRNDAQPIPSVPDPLAPGQVTTAGIGTTSPTGPKETDYFLRGTLAYEAPSGVFDAKLKVANGEQNVQNGLSMFVQAYGCAGAPALAELLHVGSRDCTINQYSNDANAPPSFTALTPLFGDGKTYLDDEQTIGSFSMNLRPVAGITISSVTGYYNLQESYLANFGYSSSAAGFGASVVDSNQLSQELRVASAFDFPVNFMAGAFYQHANLENANPAAFGNPFTGVFTGGYLSGPVLFYNPLMTLRTDAWSTFGQILIDISPKLQLTAGGRYSHEKKAAAVTIYPNAFTATTYNPILSPDSRTFENFSPEVTLTYKPISSLTAYAAYRTGFISGGYNFNAGTAGLGVVNAGDDSYNQEVARGEEVGLKGTFVNKQIDIDLSIYNFKYTGLQVSAASANALGYILTNAAAARVRGVDFTTQYRPQQINGITFRGAVSYNKAYYIKFDDAPCYTGQTQQAGCNIDVTTGELVGLTGVGNAQNLSGRPLPRAPQWSANTGATYETKIVNGMTLSLSTDASYSGSYISQAEQTPISLVDPYWRFNARIAVRGRNDTVELALIGTNLSNVLRIINTDTSLGLSTGTGTRSATPGQLIGSVTDPRTVTLQATMRF